MSNLERKAASRLRAQLEITPEEGKVVVLTALGAAHGNLWMAATLLGIGTRTLNRILATHRELAAAAVRLRRAKRRPKAPAGAPVATATIDPTPEVSDG